MKLLDAEQLISTIDDVASLHWRDDLENRYKYQVSLLETKIRELVHIVNINIELHNDIQQQLMKDTK